jgi:multiple sugar transport system permease protein
MIIRNAKGRNKKGLSQERASARRFYIFISPWLLGFTMFVLLPMCFSLYASFTSWNGVNTPKFQGLKNYIDIFTNDLMFWDSVKNTLYYVGVNVPLNMTVALLLAMLLNKRLPLTNFFRSVFYLPTILSGVAISITWLYLYNPDTGVINTLLRSIGIEGPRWLLDTQWAMPGLLIMDAFTIGTMMLIFMAGLLDVPRDYYEAATIDGANKFAMFRKITFPMISSVVFFNMIIGLIHGLQLFMQPFVMTEGGPANSTYVYALHLYKTAFLYYQFGYASALAWVLFVGILLLTLLIFATSKWWVYYREEAQ